MKKKIWANSHRIIELSTQKLFGFGIRDHGIRDPAKNLFGIQCGGCGMFLPRIPDPTFFYPGSRIRTVSIPDPGSSSKNLPQKKQKNGFLALKNMIRVVHPVSRIRMLTFSHPGSRIQDPGSRVKKAPNPGSRIRIRNTVWIPDPGVKKALDPGSGSAALHSRLYLF